MKQQLEANLLVLSNTFWKSRIIDMLWTGCEESWWISGKKVRPQPPILTSCCCPFRLCLFMLSASLLNSLDKGWTSEWRSVMYKSWIALTVGESQLFDPSFWLLAPCRRDKRDLWDSVLHTTERQTETWSLEEDPSVLYRRFFESDPFARKTEENSKDWEEQHKRKNGEWSQCLPVQTSANMLQYLWQEWLWETVGEKNGTFLDCATKLRRWILWSFESVRTYFIKTTVWVLDHLDHYEADNQNTLKLHLHLLRCILKADGYIV